MAAPRTALTCDARTPTSWPGLSQGLSRPSTSLPAARKTWGAAPNGAAPRAAKMGDLSRPAILGTFWNAGGLQAACVPVISNRGAGDPEPDTIGTGAPSWG